MKIRFRQSGGFGGIVLGCDLDVETLPPADAIALSRLIKDAKLAEVGARTNERGRDLTNYEITVEEKGATIKASFDDMSIPPKIEPLLDFLRDRARPTPLE
jgi:hypothetical protein